jgi:hypothetical protein
MFIGASLQIYETPKRQFFPNPTDLLKNDRQYSDLWQGIASISARNSLHNTGDGTASLDKKGAGHGRRAFSFRLAKD